MNGADGGARGAAESFEIDTGQAAATTSVPVTDEEADAIADDETVPDLRPLWDIEYKLGEGGGVTEVHADDAEGARIAFLAKYPENGQPQILSVEPG